MAGKGGAQPNSGGRRPGAGRPPKELHERKRWFQQRAVMEWTTVEDAQMFWQTQLSFAKAGDHNAAKLVAGYLFGLPAQPVEVSGPGGQDKPVRIEVVDYRAAIAPLGPETGQPS